MVIQGKEVQSLSAMSEAGQSVCQGHHDAFRPDSVAGELEHSTRSAAVQTLHHHEDSRKNPPFKQCLLLSMPLPSSSSPCPFISTCPCSLPLKSLLAASCYARDRLSLRLHPSLHQQVVVQVVHILHRQIICAPTHVPSAPGQAPVRSPPSNPDWHTTPGLSSALQTKELKL
eukprot:3826898-Rhodomonas_salina.2